MAVVIIGISAVALMGSLTTSVTSSAEYRSLATVDTVLKNFAEAVKDAVQVQPSASAYSDCATTYQVVSEYPTNAAIGAGVTVFGTDFNPGSVSITVGGTPVLASDYVPPTTPSVAADGTVSAPFTVPAGAPTGIDAVILNSVPSATPLTVTSSGPSAPASAATGFRMGISSIGWWNSATQGFDSPPAPCGTNDKSGIQLITLNVTTPSGAADTMSIVVTDPAFRKPVGPSVGFSVSPTNPTPGQQITITATLTGSNGVPPIGTLSWNISGGSVPPACTPPPDPTKPTSSSGSNSTWTCVLPGTQVGSGSYQVVVNYSGDVNYGPTTGSQTVVVAPFTITGVQLVNHGSTPGLIEGTSNTKAGDAVVVNFSAPINFDSFCSGWTGTPPLTGNSLEVKITHGSGSTDDSLSVLRTSGCTINFGTIDLGSNAYVTGDVIFHGMIHPTTIAWTANTLTITLGHQDPASPGSPVQNPALTTPIYTSSVTDSVGDPASNSPYTFPSPGVQF